MIKHSEARHSWHAQVRRQPPAPVGGAPHFSEGISAASLLFMLEPPLPSAEERLLSGSSPADPVPGSEPRRDKAWYEPFDEIDAASLAAVTSS